MLGITSCQTKNEKAKKEMIAERISKIKNEKYQGDSILYQSSESNKIQLKQNKSGDDILGIWEVKNEYNAAIYEIVKYENQYFAKIHYYNDGKNEFEEKKNKEDYFLEDMYFRNGQYTIGKMYMPNGNNYQVKFTLNVDDLTVEMTIDDQPYKEIWKRKKY